MPVYKDEATNTWYCKFYYSTLDGRRKQTTKRGFKTKKAAQQWESETKAANASDMNATMETFVEMYFRDKQGELKERSIKNKRYMIDTHVLPYFGGKKMNLSYSSFVQNDNSSASDFPIFLTRLQGFAIKPYMLLACVNKAVS